MSLFLTENRRLPFPVRRVYCVGRNYAEHRKEMGGSERDPPFFFMKPHDAVFQSNSIRYPMNTKELSYEGELVVIIGENEEIYGISVGVDLTKRDLQSEAKSKSRPWESSKSFDSSALIGEITPLSEIPGGLQTITNSHISLTLNGETRQSGAVSSMIWSIPELLNELRHQDFSVKKGDFSFTGTPSGVGSLSVGDACIGSLISDNLEVVPSLAFTVN